MRRVVWCMVLVCLGAHGWAQQDKAAYERAYTRLGAMLDGHDKLSFKRAVFIVENAWHADTLDAFSYEHTIQALTLQCRKAARYGVRRRYEREKEVAQNYAIYAVLADTVRTLDNGERLEFTPFDYDFEDAEGRADWTKMFVSRTLQTRTGNCHSLPYLYKILADEVGVRAYLAVAPHHLYIKHYGAPNNDGPFPYSSLFNVELTSRTFPEDAWILATGYITSDAVRSKLFMRALKDTASIALCVVDLGKGYERKFGAKDGFVERCAALARRYDPHCVNARLLEVSALRAKDDRAKLEAACAELVRLGYREMPDAMYENWFHDMRRQGRNVLDSVKYMPKRFDTQVGNPLREVGYYVPVQTLTDGRLDEFPYLADTTRIGDIVFDIQAEKIVEFKPRPFREAMLEPAVVSRWLSVDPITHAYQSPYSAFDGNPIYYIDPNGTTVGDYYNTDLKKIGTDGINDGKNYLVTNSTLAKQMEATYNPAKDNVNIDPNSWTTMISTQLLPSKGERDVMRAAIAGSNGTNQKPSSTLVRDGFAEWGGLGGTDAQGNGLAALARPGQPADPSRPGGDAEINVSNMDAANQAIVNQMVNITYSFHVHPRGAVFNNNGKITYDPNPNNNILNQVMQGYMAGQNAFAFGQNPSSHDYYVNNPFRSSTTILKPQLSGYVLAPRIDRVHIYDWDSNNTISLPLNKFLDLK